MFIQVIQGKISDPRKMEASVRRWTEELAPGARGWLGSTCGITDDGTLVYVVRFASEAEARANSDRPEQDRYWAEASKLFTGEATFHDCSDVQTLLAGGSDRAGFVQVMQGRVRDVDRLKAINAEVERTLPQHRSDVIGMTVAFSDDGTCTQTVYFTSEEDARRNESKERPPELAEIFDEEQNLIQNLAYYDLRDPWLLSPR